MGAKALRRGGFGVFFGVRRAAHCAQGLFFRPNLPNCAVAAITNVADLLSLESFGQDKQGSGIHERAME
jgi:hypothetical protein